MTRTEKKAPPEGTDAWIPEDVGDSLQGKVVDVDAAWSDWRAAQAPNDPDGGWYPLLTIRKDDGETVKLHGFRTVLYNELLKREPIPGETIIVTYMGAGKAAKAGMNPPEVYRVTVPGRPPEAARRVYGGMRRGRVAPGSGADPEPTAAAAVAAAAAEPAVDVEAERDARLGETLPE